MDVHKEKATKSVFTDLDDEVDQIWAEAMVYYAIGEKLFLEGAAANEAEEAQEAHKEVNPKEGVIVDFISRRVPLEWNKFGLMERRTYWATEWPKATEENTVPRDRICAAEIWCECFNNELKYMQRKDTVEINNILNGLKNTEKVRSSQRFGPDYGNQRGFWIM